MSAISHLTSTGKVFLAIGTPEDLASEFVLDKHNRPFKKLAKAKPLDAPLRLRDVRFMVDGEMVKAEIYEAEPLF